MMCSIIKNAIVFVRRKNDIYKVDISFLVNPISEGKFYGYFGALKRIGNQIFVQKKILPQLLNIKKLILKQNNKLLFC